MVAEFLKPKVQSMVDAGFLSHLVDLDQLENYWQNMLKDFPDHPALGSTCTSIPLTLYGDLTDLYLKDFKTEVLYIRHRYRKSKDGHYPRRRRASS